MFTHGQSVTYKGLNGFVNFISEYYITICFKKYESDSMHGETYCCLLVYPNEQDQVYVLDSK